MVSMKKFACMECRIPTVLKTGDSMLNDTKGGERKKHGSTI